jgi:hypothetical protein
MKNLFAIFLSLTCIGTPAIGQIGSIMDPYPIGTAAATIITFGDAYSTAIETYDARITLIEAVRGEKALDLLRKQNTSFRTPDDALISIFIKPSDLAIVVAGGQTQARFQAGNLRYASSFSIDKWR